MSFSYQYVKYDFCNYAAVLLHTMLLYADERKIRFDLPKKIEARFSNFINEMLVFSAVAEVVFDRT